MKELTCLHEKVNQYGTLQYVKESFCLKGFFRQKLGHFTYINV